MFVDNYALENLICSLQPLILQLPVQIYLNNRNTLAKFNNLKISLGFKLSLSY